MPRRSYSEEFQREAVAKYQLIGLSAAAREMGVAKTSLVAWAEKFGLEPRQISEKVSEQANLASRRAAEERTKRVNDAMEARLDRLLDLSGVALARELRILGDAEQSWGKDDLQAVTNARYKGIHDLQLLLGRATERGNDHSEMMELLKQAFAGAMIDAGLDDEEMARVRAAFAHRIRQASVQEP